jgi:hypothetical protein
LSLLGFHYQPVEPTAEILYWLQCQAAVNIDIEDKINVA